MSTEMILKHINIDDIDNDWHLNNARGEIGPHDVTDLAEDIKKHGLLQPIVVRPGLKDGKPYRLVAGFCRFMSCAILQHQTIPCVVKDCTDLEAQLYNINENLKRKNLSMLQEARCIKAILEISPLMNEFDIAEKLGQSRGWVQIRKYILSLPDDIQFEIGRGYFTTEQVRFIWQQPKEKQYEMVRALKNAKTRGERVNLLRMSKKAKPANIKEPRDRSQIFLMMQHIQANAGNSFATRCLAWTAGEITDVELFTDLKIIMDASGKDYVIPATRLVAP